MPFKPDTCVFHHPCNDGFGAAWVIKKRWPDVQLYAAEHGKPLPALIGDVLFVDFTPPLDQMQKVLRRADHTDNAVIVLDHHKSAKDVLDLCDWHWNQGPDHPRAETVSDGTSGFCLDLSGDYSGVDLAWDFASPGGVMSDLLNLISIRDRWDDRAGLLVEAHMVSAFLRSLPFEIKDWTEAIVAYEESRSGRAAIMKAGEAIRGFIQQRCREILERDATPIITAIGDHLVPMVNAPNWISSDLGEAMLVKYRHHPFVAMYEDQGDMRIWSLRCDDRSNGVDLAEVAKSYGGGGHAKAAGFTTPR